MYFQIIEGNTDNYSVKRKDLEQEVVTRYVRFSPVDWYCWPCLRVEVYGAALNINGENSWSAVFAFSLFPPFYPYVLEKFL